MAKVSVLVAVYNASDYLHKCIDSLLNQTLTDIQIICIDDCSTDSSVDILEAYAQHDRRVEVIRLDSNQGQAYARNIGLERATGEYVCMLDSDDWFSEDALQKAVDAFDDNTDCVLFDVMMSWNTHSYVYSMPAFDKLTGKDAFRLSLDWQIHGLYMIRTDLHMRIPYDTSCKLYSDDNTTRVHYFASRNVGRCEGIYYYRQHETSATHSVSVRRFDYLRANESMKNQLVALKADKELMALYENHRWLNLVDVYMFYHCHGRELAADDCQYGLSEIRRIWNTIDRNLLNKKTTAKFGYRPMCCWSLFRIQEWLYFTTRGLLGKNY